MDLESQREIERVARSEDKDQLVVLCGPPDADGAASFAGTVSAGELTFAGPLAGVPLGLAVFHVVEPAIKAQIPNDVYEKDPAVIEDVVDVDAICSRLAAVNASAPR
jgi:glycine/sarcosine/betaine reductase complex component A